MAQRNIKAEKVRSGEAKKSATLGRRALKFLDARQSVLDKIDPELTLRDSEKVKAFIKKNRNPQGFVNWINSTARKVGSYFEGEPLYLQLFADPEGPENDKLIISVSTAQDGTQSWNTLEQFYNEVLFNDESEFVRKLDVSLEFR